MGNPQLIQVSDFYKLAALDLSRIAPTRTEHNGRFWAYFLKDDAEKVLSDFESGDLKVVARDFVAAVQRVKDRIFESERIARATNGDRHANSYR